MRIEIKLLTALMLVASIILIGCKPENSQETFRKVDDYPLYVMHIYQDYYFDDYLESGKMPGIALPSSSQLTDKDWACSCFSAFNLPHQAIFGRNYDWSNDFPALLLFTHPANGYASVSMVDLSMVGFGTSDSPWGDRSDKQKLLYTPYFPLDGMNERGLTVALMSVPESQPPYDPNKVNINVMTGIRLILDKAQTVDEALSLLGDYNIPLIEQHYLIADAYGNSAVVEFIESEMKVIRSEQPWQVSTNFVLSRISERDRWTCWRYTTASEKLGKVQGALSHEEAMVLLKEISQNSASDTIWSLVYDMVSGEIDIAMARDYDKVYHFKLGMKNK